MQEQPSYYAVIPADVRYANIPANAKLLYGEISALCNEKGYCWASNKYFAERYNVSTTSISMWIKCLVDNGFIKSQVVRAENGFIRKIAIKENLKTPIRKLKDPPIRKLTYNNKEKNNKVNIISKDITAEAEYGNKNINEIVDYFKAKMDLPQLDGTIKSNRYSANRLLTKSKGNIDVVKMLIDCLAQDEFHSQNASSINYLDKHAVAIMQRARKNNQKMVSI